MTRRMTKSSGPPFIEVSSVDGFQGREKEAVVFSAVRSNAYGQIGFTSDWRRINVSFTRARRALIVIGNDQTLRRGDPDTWMPWLAWADAHGIHMDRPGVRLDLCPNKSLMGLLTNCHIPFSGGTWSL